jgi:large subunit ribosomal protein L22
MPGPKTNEREGTRAVLRNEGVSAYKVRPVLDLIRGQDVALARDTLDLCERDAALLVGKLLTSAVANAENNDGIDREELYVSACYADEGATAKRWRPRARGRATRIRKRSCHITVIVSRLPEDRLNRLRARQAAEAGNRRARRGAGGRQGRRTRRDEQVPGTAPAPETAAAPAPAEVESATAEAPEETTAPETTEVEDTTAADTPAAEGADDTATDDEKDS